MFAIYDIEGRPFRNTLENLRQVRGAQGMFGTRLRSNSQDGDPPPLRNAAAGKHERAIVSNKALRAYREELRRLNQRAPIYHAHQLMSNPVISVRMDMGIAEAWKCFQKHEGSASRPKQ
jgi:acetoin utilization protein AcuB